MSKKVKVHSVFGYSKEYVEQIISESESKQKNIIKENRDLKSENSMLCSDLESARRELDPLLKENADLKMMIDSQRETVRRAEESTADLVKKHTELTNAYNSIKLQFEQSAKVIKSKNAELEMMRIQLNAMQKMNDSYKARECTMSGLIDRLNNEFERNASMLKALSDNLGDLCNKSRQNFDKTMCDMADVLISDDREEATPSATDVKKNNNVNIA